MIKKKGLIGSQVRKPPRSINIASIPFEVMLSLREFVKVWEHVEILHFLAAILMFTVRKRN